MSTRLSRCPCYRCGQDTVHIGRACSECGEVIPPCRNAILPDARPGGCRRPEDAKAHRERISKIAGAAFARSRAKRNDPSGAHYQESRRRVV